VTSLAALTGQSTAFRMIQEWLDAESTYAITLEGPSGCGKSWLAEQISGTGLSVLYARGFKANIERPLHPFKIALDLSYATPSVEQLAIRFAGDVASEAAKFIPAVGQSVSRAISITVAQRDLEQARGSNALTQDERDILTELGKRVGNNRVLFVLDDLQWWDDASLDLLLMIIAYGHLYPSFSYLQRVSYLTILTTGLSFTARARLNTVRQLLHGPTIRLHYASPENFAAILSGFGLKGSLSPGRAAELYRLSRGNLVGAALFARYFNEKGGDTQLPLAGDFDTVCRSMVDDQITLLGARGDPLRLLLSYAATIGPSFSHAEIQCLAEDIPDLPEVLGDAKGLSIINEDGIYLFSHELFSRIFVPAELRVAQEYHSRFAACLHQLRPSDYASRADHLELAGLPLDAAIMKAHAYISEMRYGRLLPDERSVSAVSSVAMVSDSMIEDLDQFLITISRMQRDFENGSYPAVIALSDDVDETLPSSLLAERDLIAAQALIKQQSRRHREAALRLLSRWENLWENELEVWARIVLARIVALAHLDAISEAKAAANEVASRLRTVAAHDAGCNRTRYRIMLRADMMYSPDAAHRQLTRAIDYFGPAGAEMSARDPRNYYIGLANLTANYLFLGRFGQAYDTAIRCKAFSHAALEREAIRLPRLDILENNLLISSYRADKLSAAEAAARMKELLTTETSNDTALLASNYSAFSLLAGMAGNRVAAILQPLFDDLAGEGDFDSYYGYFVGNNLATCYIAIGNLPRATLYFDRIEPLLASIRVPLQRFLILRHKLLKGRLEDPQLTLSEWETPIASSELSRFGSMWSHFAHGLLLSDLEFWADD
jgi:AAA ATPase domain